MISFYRLILILTCLLFSQVTFSKTIAHVILTKGSVTAQVSDNEPRVLKRRSAIFTGDTIITGKKSSVQIRFIDKALLTIKANSKFNIEAYQLANGENSSHNKAIMNLLKGGFRTITGSIGKGDKKAYQVNTPAASIGIRGTNYEVQQESINTFVMAVYSGGIYVQNASGSINLGFDSDFNYTRVRQGNAPKGLLIIPKSLTLHTTTAQEDEKQISESSGQKEDLDDESETDTLTSSEPDSGTDLAALELARADTPPSIDPEDNELPPLQAPLSNTPDNNPDVIPEPLVDIPFTEPLDDTPFSEPLADIPFAEPEPIIDPLENFPDPIIPEDNPTPTPPNEPDAPRSATLFDFSDPYSQSTPVPSPMQGVINDAEYGLMESGQLATMAIPLFNSNTMQAQAGASLSTVSDPSSTTINVHYEAINPETGLAISYEQDVSIDINVTSLAQLQQRISHKLEHKGAKINGIHLGHSDLLADFKKELFDYLKTKDKKFDKDFIKDLIAKIKALIAKMKSPYELPDDLPDDLPDEPTNTNTGLQIGNGAWDMDSDNPLIGLESSLDEGGETIDRLEILYKPVTADATVNNLPGFFACTDSNKACDIKVDLVALAHNIRWGAWLAEPTDQIQVYQHDTDSSGNATGQFNNQDNMLLFWIAAERADINQLTGSASFSGSGNCTDFSQCIGIADDGMTQSISGQFDVNFNNGNISNGQLTVNTAAANSSIYSSDPLSTWQVNFSGQMQTGQPEFVSDSLNGTVSQNGQQVSDTVTGNVGGIFVKPGDNFAGGYNLNTQDGTNKYTAGVFTLKKEP